MEPPFANRRPHWIVVACGLVVVVGLGAAWWWLFHERRVAAVPDSPAPLAVPSSTPLASGPLFPPAMPTASSSAQFLNSLTNEPELTQSIGVGLGFRPVTQKPITRELQQSFLNAPPPINMWGRLVIGPSPALGVGLQIKLRLFWMRLRNVLFGSPWPIGTRLTMDNAMAKYAMIERLDYTSAFTIFYAPGMDGSLIGLQTISGTNHTTKGPSMVRMTLKELLALNGYTLVELRPNVIKVYPTNQAAQYGSQTIDETKYPY